MLYTIERIILFYILKHDFLAQQLLALITIMFLFKKKN